VSTKTLVAAVSSFHQSTRIIDGAHDVARRSPSRPRAARCTCLAVDRSTGVRLAFPLIRRPISPGELDMPTRSNVRNLGPVAGALMAAALLVGWPSVRAHLARRALATRLDQVTAVAGGAADLSTLWMPAAGDSSLLTSWQSVGGCGAGAASGGGVGVKWIGRSVSGGLFSVQSQGNYTRIHSTYVEDQLFLNNLITRDVSERWQLGVSVPVVYKYLRDPYGLNIDLSNSGLGDVNLQSMWRLGAVNNTLLTASVGLPTGKYNQRYKNAPLRAHSQLGFGRFTGALTLDHIDDEIWGLFVTGASATWRGGENSLSNYRAPSGSAYMFTGWFLGPLVPALGVSVTGFTGHDRDQGQDENSALFQAAPTVSLEWASPYVAILAGASFPYQYNGVLKDSNGKPVSPWGWADWTVSLGLSFAPF
jgi:hypothetical protein